MCSISNSLLIVECRFEEAMKTLESSLTFEKQQHEASLVELAEAREKIEELQSEVGDTDEKSTLLQTTIQRFFLFFLCNRSNRAFMH